MAVALLLLLGGAAAPDETVLGDEAPTDQQHADQQRLAGDYFVGASVFLFERTVLAAFAPPGNPGSADTTLDAGAIYLASENAGNESGSVALDAILGWLTAGFSGDKKNAAAKNAEPPPGLGPDRRHALACLVYGADPNARADLAQRAGIGEDERADCVDRYAEARKKWAGWLLPYRKAPDSPAPVRASPEGAPAEGAPVLRLAFAPTMDDADQAIADAMQRNGLFQVLTDDLNATLSMPRPVTALLTQCGEAKAFYNADRGEAVLCYELLGALLQAAP